MSISLKQVLSIVVPVCIFLCIFLSLPLVCAHGHSHDHSHGHSHDHHHHHEDPAFKYSKAANEPQKRPEPTATPQESSNVWLEAMTATLLISLAPYLILFLIPINNASEHQPLLKVLLAFASGGLLGDAFLHLIPHALLAQQAKQAAAGHAHSHSHSHSHAADEEGHGHDNTIGLSVLAGILTFLVVEKMVRIFKGGHGHSHSKPSDAKVKKTNGDAKVKKSEKKNSSNSDIKVAGYLNLAADFTHNVTDGLAIGASFLAGRSVGIVTTVTIFLHEIPHEIGDFAILLQSGCSKRKAMLLQLVTAVGALSGTAISLLAEGADDENVAWILPFTAGGFIYIATVSVIPELLEQSSLWQSLCEVAALVAGVVLMLIIAAFEEAGHA